MNSAQAYPHSGSLFRMLESICWAPRSVLPSDVGILIPQSHPPPLVYHALQKPEGREHLRRLLNWEEFDELRDSRRSILLDTLYESIIFAVGKGFPWVEVAQVVKFTEELLKETKGTGHPGQESARLGEGTQPQELSEKPGAPSFISLAFSLLVCSQRGSLSRFSGKWSKQNVLAESYP